MKLLELFSKGKSKEVGIAAAKGSIPAAGATGIITGVSVYLGIDLPVESIVGYWSRLLFFHRDAQVQGSVRQETLTH